MWGEYRQDRWRSQLGLYQESGGAIRGKRKNQHHRPHQQAKREEGNRTEIPTGISRDRLDGERRLQLEGHYREQRPQGASWEIEQARKNQEFLTINHGH